MGFRKADDFYIALGGAKISPKVVVNKVMQRLKQGEAAEERAGAADDARHRPRRSGAQPTGSSNAYGIRVEGVDDVHAAAGEVLPPGARRPDRRLRLARARHHDPPRRLPERRGAAQGPGALRRACHWEGDHETSFKVELQIDAWDRHRLLEDLSRTFAEAGINIVEARCIVNAPMVKNRFVVEVADTQALKSTISRLRNIEAVFDAYRVTRRRG